MLKSCRWCLGMLLECSDDFEAFYKVCFGFKASQAAFSLFLLFKRSILFKVCIFHLAKKSIVTPVLGTLKMMSTRP